MKTYAKSRGKREINWLFELQNTPLKDKKKWYVLFQKSTHWPTCAVGNQCDIIPRNLLGKPFDKELASLGGDFTIMVQRISKDVKDPNVFPLFIEKERLAAIECFHKIEKRSKELIDEINGTVQTSSNLPL